MLKAMLRHLGAGPPERILAIGGSTRNQLLMRLKASVYGAPLAVMDLPDTTCLGAALLGGLAAGLFTRHRGGAPRPAGAGARSWSPTRRWSEDHRQRRQTTYAAAYAALRPAARPAAGRLRRLLFASGGDARYCLGEDVPQTGIGAMRWQMGRRSENIEDRRGMAPSGMGRGVRVGGIGGLGIAGAGPGRDVPGRGPVDHPERAARRQRRREPAAVPRPAAGRRTTRAPSSSRRCWRRPRTPGRDIFRQAGQTYEKPPLVLFDGRSQSACGMAGCGHRAVLLPGRPEGLSRHSPSSTSSSQKFGAPGDFAAGLRHRPRGRPSRPDPARHLAPGDQLRQQSRRGGPRTGCR